MKSKKGIKVAPIPEKNALHLTIMVGIPKPPKDEKSGKRPKKKPAKSALKR